MNWTFTINPQQLWETYILPWGTQIVLALLIFIIGRMLAGFVTRTTTKALERARLDPILISFLATVMNSTLVLLVIVLPCHNSGSTPPHWLPCSVPPVWPLAWR